MRKHMAWSWALITAALVLASCAGKSNDYYFGRSVPVTIASKQAGNHADLPPGLHVIRSLEELEAIGSEAFEGIEVDFDTQTLVVLSLGERPSGGYWAHIVGAQMLDGKLYIQGVVNRPGPDDAVTLAITYPYSAAVLNVAGELEVASEIDQVEGQPAP